MPFPLFPPPTPPLPPQFPDFPPAGDPNGPPDVTVYSDGHFGNMLGQLLDSAWVANLLNGPGGAEIIIGALLTGSRMSLAAALLEGNALLAYAFDAAYSTGAVNFFRPNATHGAVTIKAGTVVGTSRTGRTFETVSDAAFGALDVGPLFVKIRARTADYQHDVQGEVVTPGGEVLPGEIDTIITWVQDPPFTDPTIFVRGDSTKEGRFPDIDALGQDRGLPRAPGEATPPYRLRCRTLPDTVSRGAVERNARSILAPFGAPFEVVEAGEHRLIECWDAPSDNPGTPTFRVVLPPAPFSTDGFAYDDTYPVPAFRSRWLDEITFRGMFAVLAPRWAALRDLGMAYDDTAVTVDEHTRLVGTVTGTRGHAAYDVPSDYLPALGYGGAYDGFDLGARGVYLALYNLMQQIKAGGVIAFVERRT